MKNELYFYLTQAIRSKITTVLASVVSFALLLTLPLVKNDAGKFLIASASLTAASTALLSGRNLHESEDALNDFAATTGLKRQRTLLWGEHKPPHKATDPHQPTSATKVPLFDLKEIGNKRDEFPNVFVVGAPGTGKTTLAEYLGVVLEAGLRFAVHPHAKPTDFKGFDRIFGGGRNIGSPEDEEVEWAKVASGAVVPSVAQVIMALYGLMKERYELYYTGTSNFAPIDVYFDEVPAIASQLGKPFMKRYIPPLIMECRKVGIRLWFLTQTFRVEPLGLDGVGDLKEGATVIRLGKLAQKEAHTLFSKRQISEDTLLEVKYADRPIMVDESASKLPGFTEMQAAISSFVQQRKTPPVEAAKPKRTRSKKKIPPST